MNKPAKKKRTFPAKKVLTVERRAKNCGKRGKKSQKQTKL